MPIAYRIDPELHRIFTSCSGNTTLHEVIAHFGELEIDPECPAGADVLLDLSGMTSIPNVGQMRTAAERAGEAARTVRFGAIAVVAASEAIFGMARVFETFTERHFARSGVFRSREAAEKWLDGPASH
ncbi:MAG TPA: hypothetical protein VH854_10455 [Thermoanaerobaculia bacterium]|nr:hypothetical protein [Thermoanaerobaculia bacterium]